MIYTRREIGKLALAALPAARSWAAKPNWVFGGVQVGINAPAGRNRQMRSVLPRHSCLNAVSHSTDRFLRSRL